MNIARKIKSCFLSFNLAGLSKSENRKKQVLEKYKDEAFAIVKNNVNLPDWSIFGRNACLFKSLGLKNVLTQISARTDKNKPIKVLDAGMGGGGRKVIFPGKEEIFFAPPEPWEIMALMRSNNLQPFIFMLDRKQPSYDLFIEGRQLEILDSISRTVRKKNEIFEEDYKDNFYRTSVCAALEAQNLKKIGPKQFTLNLPADWHDYFCFIKEDIITWQSIIDFSNFFSLVFALNVLGYMKRYSYVFMAVSNLLKVTRSGGYLVLSNDARKADFLYSGLMQKELDCELIDSLNGKFNQYFILAKK